jgi:hypothetical protein
MTFAISTSKGKKTASHRWNETFVLFGNILVHKTSCTTSPKVAKWVFMKTMMTRVNGSNERVWCDPEVVPATDVRAQASG